MRRVGKASWDVDIRQLEPKGTEDKPQGVDTDSGPRARAFWV